MESEEKLQDLPAESGCGGNQYIVTIITENDDDMPKRQDEDIVIVRSLSDAELARLRKAKTREEILYLIEHLININEPTVYEIDLR